MQIVINIPKYVYDTIIACGGYISDCDNEKVGNAIKNGILLPKGHGRLIDAERIKIVRTPGSAVDENTEIIICAIKQYINQLSAIIEADTESEV